jgi:tRNA (guanine-N7-)-methyltransferase
MPKPVQVTIGDCRRALTDLPSPLPLGELLPGDEGWEIELGFGKGRFLLAQAAARPATRFLGIEWAGKYLRLALDRAHRRGLRNLIFIEGEARYLLATALPAAFADVVHIYFPDPWPKARHRRRRLLDEESIDLVLRALAPGGRLCFATDFLEYGESAHDVLSSHGALRVREVDGGWPGGPRTNYEAKYVAEGRPILRLEAVLSTEVAGLHPHGAARVLAATAPAPESDPAGPDPAESRPAAEESASGA